MTTRFSLKFNPHYQFDHPENIAEIARQDKFDEEGALLAMPPYVRNGISVVESPWGINQSKEYDAADSNTISAYLSRFNLTPSDVIHLNAKQYERAQPLEYCVKDLIVHAGHQLSLQMHRGREEFWIVKKGLLTVIIDGECRDVKVGHAIFIPKGSVHCMNNVTDYPIEVEELQIGICREDDNIRLLDATRDAQGRPKPRPTYPLSNNIQYESAKLYAKLANQIALKKAWPPIPQFDHFL